MLLLSLKIGDISSCSLLILPTLHISLMQPGSQMPEGGCELMSVAGDFPKQSTSDDQKNLNNRQFRRKSLFRLFLFLL